MIIGIAASAFIPLRSGDGKRHDEHICLGEQEANTAELTPAYSATAICRMLEDTVFHLQRQVRKPAYAVVTIDGPSNPIPCGISHQKISF